MERPLDPSAIVLSERADPMDNVVQVLARDCRFAQIDCTVRKSALGLAPEIHNDFDSTFEIRLAMERFPDLMRHHAEEKFEVVRDFLAGQFTSPRSGVDLLL